MKFLKSVKIITALVLTLTIIMLLPLQTAAAAENNGKYVSEVYVAYGKDADEAKKTLEDKGFTPVEGNLNDGGKTFAMMGYKTTDDIRESITDLAVMNMRGSYSVEDYKSLIKAKKTEIADFLTEFMAIIREYRTNLKAGKARAEYVRDMLNKYTEDDTGMKMGDLLNSETLQDKVGIEESIAAENPENLPDLITILMQGNTQVIRSIETLLAIAADTADNSWVDRFADSSYDDLLDKAEEERPELNTEAKRLQYLDNIYGGFADALALESADLGNRLKDYAESGLDVLNMSDEDIKKNFGDIENNPDALIAYRNMTEVASLREGLANYEGGRFKKGELLDFFMNDIDPEDTEVFMPMAAALSEGQRNGLIFVGLEKLLTYAFTTDDGWKEYTDKNKSSYEDIEEVSVYQNIDRDMFRDDGSVAMTDAAQRANNTADGTTGDEEDKMDTLSKITVISWAAGLTALLVSAKVAVALQDKAILSASQGTEELIRNMFHDKAAYKQFYEAASKGGVDPSVVAKVNTAQFANMISKVLVVVAIVVYVWTTVMTIIDMQRDKSIEQLPIPNYVVDNYTDADGGSYSINYKAVECNRADYFGADYKIQKGSSADLMADEGKQWLVLYASKNSKAGKPLTPDFIVQKSSTAPTGYEGIVHLIGEKGAVNVSSRAFKNYSTFSTVWQNITGDYTKFIFCKLSNDTKTYDEAAGNMTATAMSGGMIAIIGLGGLALGAALGAIVAAMVSKNKKKKETA